MIVAGALEAGRRKVSCGIIKPAVSMTKGKPIMAAPVIVNAGADVVPLRLLNLSNDNVTVYKGTSAGTFQVVDAIGPSLELMPEDQGDGEQINRVASTDCTDSSGPDLDVPIHLQSLYEEASKHLNDGESGQLLQLLTRFQGQFAAKEGDLGRTELTTHRIETGTSAPIKQRPRRIPLHQKVVVEAEINAMLEKGVIKPASGPWASPIVLVRKKDGKVRFCVDYRRLNAVTQKDAYPIPRIDDTIDTLSGAKYFSTLDLASGYWQVPIEEEHKEKTAFATHCGLFQFEVMPFGLTNAPSTFERLMERVLRGLQWQVCLVYLDDVIVYSRTFDEHVERLQLVFDRIKEVGLKLQPKKCHLLQREVMYLGHIVSDQGVRTDPEKIRQVKEWQVPRNVHDVRSFLGLASYYRRFVAGFAEIARPLHRLTEAGRPFVWTHECQTAFNYLKLWKMEKRLLTQVGPLPRVKETIV